jgi:ankyrin repeat protein
VVDSGYPFHLGMEIKSAAGFDDIVFRCEQNGKTIHRFIQIKHKRNSYEKISIGDLLTQKKKSEFGLIKYFIAYLKIEGNRKFPSKDPRYFIIATNIDFDFESLAQHRVRKLRAMLRGKNRGKEVSVKRINTKKNEFLNIRGRARYKFDSSTILYLQENMDFISAKVGRKIGDKEIEGFLKRLVFTVNLPNYAELSEIITDELSKGLNNVDKKNFFSRCIVVITNLMDEEEVRVLSREEGKALLERIEREIQEKPVEFNMLKLVASFTGRKGELEEIHGELQKSVNEQAEVSQIVVIGGIKGVGKTECARKYVYDRKEYYDNNIIWINACDSKTMENSFRELAQNRLGISIEDKHGKGKAIVVIVKEVYAFFVKRRCIFIFDSAQRYEDISKFLPSFSHSQYPYGKKPYILITSCNQKWEASKSAKKIEVIRLSELERTEALELVRKALNIQDDEQDEEIDKLTRELQHFPLALGQAVAYICNKDRELKLRSNESFTISNYLEKCNQQAEKEELFKEVEELLKELSCDSEEKKDKENTVLYTKAVLTTLSIAIEDIIQEECGSEALNILEIMAYLASNDIYIKGIFIKLIADNERKLWKAVGLLNRYRIINSEAGIANIHELVQMLTRLKLEKAGREEETLRRAMGLINSSDVTQDNTIHVASVWGYASKYGKLIDDFYFNSTYIYGEPFFVKKSIPLHLLAENGYCEAIQRILTHIEEHYQGKLAEAVNVENNHGQTPLHIAAENGELDVVEYLVGKGANIHSEKSGWTPLHTAAYSGKLDVVKYLINEGAGVNTRNKYGGTALHRAAYRGNLDIVEYLVNKGADINADAMEPFLNGTPLHFAVYGENSNVVEYLVNSGANINAKDKDGRAILHIATENGELEIIKCLISKNADIDIKSKYDDTPLHVAAYNGKLDAVKYLVSRGADINAKNKCDSTPLHSAAESGNIDIVEYLVKKGADVKAKNKGAFFSGTPLHMAALRGSLKMVEYLVSEGADVDAKNKYNETPLHYAARSGNLKVVEYFFAKGTCFNIKTKIGNTLLHFAVRSERLEVVGYFVEKGIDINVKNKCNETPLHYAARNGNLDIAEYLIEKGIDINAKNKNGNTSLHFAVIRWRIDVAKLLLKHNADVNAKNNEGMTALHYATNGNHPELVELLLAHNANPVLEPTKST